MNKKYLVTIIGITVIVAVAVFSTWLLNPERKMKKEIREATGENEVVIANATEALKFVTDVANELSEIKSGTVFNFAVVDADGRSANFGIVQYIDEVKGERIVEEHMVVFNQIGTAHYSEVDRDTHKVIAMHREPQYSPYQAEQLEKTAREFVKRVYPEFEQIELTLEFDPGSKNAPGVATNHFFRWNDKVFAVPNGLDMDIPPFIQVGINSSGFIFSYDNTIALYHNLSKEDLRTLCGFVEMPQTDDSSLDPEKGIVKVWFSEYEPFQNRYLVLPYEPETDFAGCSESAKTYLRHLPNEPK